MTPFACLTANSGLAHDEIDTRATVSNCMRLHQRLVTLGTRWKPRYDIELVVDMPQVDCGEYLDDIRRLGKVTSPLALEQILTRARLPAIVAHLEARRPTLVYTHSVGGIVDELRSAIEAAGHRVGVFTGEEKDGLQAFLQGHVEVLIGSSAIATGVDGLQHVCERLIINVLPWTNAEFEQLKGRLWRQGQRAEKVSVTIPVTFAIVNGQRWSWCDAKLRRLNYKKSIADAAVDGVVPEGNLRTPAQAQHDVLAWLERLDRGDSSPVARRRIVVPLGDTETDAGARRLARYGDFPTLNNRWNLARSDTLAARLAENPEEWEHYHALYAEARRAWPVVPVEQAIAWCRRREGYVIGDFGCGTAMLADAVSDRHVVHSFDHVAIDERVVAGDMSVIPLDDETLDVAVFSLSLMGANFTDYLREARRTLKLDGILLIWEATNRFDDPKRFADELKRIGLDVSRVEQAGAFTHIQAIKVDRGPEAGAELRFRA